MRPRNARRAKPPMVCGVNGTCALFSARKDETGKPRSASGRLDAHSKASPAVWWRRWWPDLVAQAEPGLAMGFNFQEAYSGGAFIRRGKEQQYCFPFSR